MTDTQQLVEAALAASTADSCVAFAEEQSTVNLRWANNGLTTNGVAHTRSLTVVSVVDRSDGAACGVVTRSVSTLDEVDDVVRAADEAARAAQPADDAMPLAELYPHDDDWSADAVRTDASVFDRLAPDLGRQFQAWRAADRVLYGFAEHAVTSTFLATSTGLKRRFDQPDGRIELNGKTGDLRHSSYANGYTTDFTDVDVATMTDRLQHRLGWGVNRVELPPGRYETILPPSTVADLMIYLYWVATARDAEQGRSVFSGGHDGTRIGESLSALPLRLSSDPSRPGIECAPFQVWGRSAAGQASVFDNGVPVGPVDWLRDGRLTNLVGTRAWARQSAIDPQPRVGNLILDGGGADDVEAMVAATEHGLLLTSMWYIREVDPQNLLLTGLTRDGVFLVEKGRVVAEVNNFRYNESPVDLLGRATQVGRSERAMSREWADFFRRTSMPALRIPDFLMSTVSDAN